MIAKGLRAVIDGVRAYVSAPRPAVRANNLLALLIAGNQPFYPFYVRYVAGDDGGASFITLLSTPVFLAIPWIARKSETTAFALLPVTGIANAMLATYGLGRAGGIELFLIPCLLAGVFASMYAGWKTIVPIVIAMCLTYAATFAAVQSPIAQFDAVQYAALYKLNAISVALLSVYIVYVCFVALPRITSGLANRRNIRR